MKKMYKKSLFCWLLLAACLMNMAHGYAQNNSSPSTLCVISSEHENNGANPAMNTTNRGVGDRGWYYYDDGNYVDALGLSNGGSFNWGVMFPAGSYTGNTVTKVSMYDHSAHAGSIKIYQGGTTAPGTLVYTQAYACTGSNNFIEWTMSTPVAINSNQNLWIVMQNNNGQYIAPACNDMGNPNGRWVSTDGSTWMDLTSLNLNFTWMLRACLETSYDWDFENGIPNGWTTIDADGDGYNWQSVVGNSGSPGHNNSNGLATSSSWVQGVGPLTPDNFLVSPQVNLGGTFSFWACAQDSGYPSEHFGVAVSTIGNTNPNNFTTIQAWTLTAKDVRSKTDDTRSDGRAQGNWYQYTVSLSNYTGQTGYIAIRHFNCTDMFRINIDDVMLNSSTQYYTVNVTANPANGGTVSGGGTYASGTTCNLHAIANSGYAFQKWTKNGTQVSTNPNYSFTVTESASYIAHFQQNVTYYTITATANPTSGGTVTGGGSYASGSTCTLHATAHSGYTFMKWTKNGTQVSTNPNYSFTVTGNAAYVAHFQQNITYYTITATTSPTNGGTVTGGGTYASGSTCTLHATPNSGYSFVKWTKNGTQVSTNPDYSFTVTSNATFIAYFQQDANNYTVNVLANPSAGGSVTGGGTYQQGQQCTVTATVNNGYSFVKWTEGGNEVSTQTDYTFIVNSNRILVANFQIQSYTVTAIADPADGGTIMGDGIYDYGDVCTLTAIPALGYSFDEWTNNGVQVSTNPTASFIVSGDIEYVAHFVQSVNSFTITAVADPTTGGTVTGDGNYNQGDTCTLIAIPNNDYTFVKWTNNGIVVSEEEFYTFPVTENATYVAHFTQSISGYVISVSANPPDGGTITGEGTYAQGITIVLTATPSEGYRFKNWTENGVIQWLTDQYEFVVDRDRTLIANFESLPTFTVSAMAGPYGTITPQGDVQVIQGADQTFTMTPNAGCLISKVMVDGIDIGPVNTYTFTNVNRNHTIYVSFSGMGVEESQDLDVRIYPNPAKDIVYVEGEGIATIALYDMLGTYVVKMDYQTNKQLNLNDLPQGVYILMLTTQDGRIGYKKLVVNK